MDTIVGNSQNIIGLLIGFGLIGFGCLMSILIAHGTERIKTYIDIFSTLIIACATLALVGVTYLHMDEAKKSRQINRKMSEETKRIADITTLSHITSRLPILDISIQKDKKSENTWNTFIENKGNGPAFNVRALIYRNNQKSDRKKALFGHSSVDTKTSIKVIPIIGPGEKMSLLREYFNTVDVKVYKISCWDLFHQIRRYEFEGDRMEIKLHKFPSFHSNENYK